MAAGTSGMPHILAEPNFSNLQFLAKAISRARQETDHGFLSSLALKSKPMQGRKSCSSLAIALGTSPHVLSLRSLDLCWHSGKGSAQEVLLISDTESSPQTHTQTRLRVTGRSIMQTGQKLRQQTTRWEQERRNHNNGLNRKQHRISHECAH